MNSASELKTPQNGKKKTCQALESLSSDVPARSKAKITILGEDEQDTDATNRTSRNLALSS